MLVTSTIIHYHQNSYKVEQIFMSSQFLIKFLNVLHISEACIVL